MSSIIQVGILLMDVEGVALIFRMISKWSLPSDWPWENGASNEIEADAKA